MGKNCKIVACLEAKRLEFCYECATYPECEKLHGIADYLLKRGENLMENLEEIKAGKTEEWLEEEKMDVLEMRQAHFSIPRQMPLVRSRNEDRLVLETPCASE